MDMMEFIISAGLFLAKVSAVVVMAASCAAIYIVESRKTADSAL